MFENIIGNKKVKKILSEIDEPAHAYMFLGTEGIGKLLFAKEFSSKWLCLSDVKPCGKCKACIQFKNDNNINFNIIEQDGNSIKIEQIRDLIKKVYEKPIDSNKKIYIINDADKMTIPAQNALLKVLEEPPLYVIIILIGSSEHLFLNTIKSRCIKINFNALEKEEINEYLIKNEKKINEKLLDVCEGSIGKIKKIEEMEETYLKLENLIVNIKNFNKIKFLKEGTELINKDNIYEMLKYINILLLKLGKKDIKYLNAIKFVNIAIKQYNSNVSVEMILDNVLLDIYENLIEL